MDKNIFKLMFIGILTGIVASFVGGGAEILIVPLLIYLKVFEDYKTAIGTSLASLLLPIGIVAVYFYARQRCKGNSCVRWNYAFILSFFFILGTFASYFTAKLETKYLKLIFAGLLVVFGITILIECIHE
tara:strand:- start:258 stop:647 length:390 start_codon:yes stop_codon:yes gene_type:complete